MQSADFKDCPGTQTMHVVCWSPLLNPIPNGHVWVSSDSCYAYTCSNTQRGCESSKKSLKPMLPDFLNIQNHIVYYCQHNSSHSNRYAI